MRKDVNDMFEIKGKVTTAICYAKVIEDEAIEQIRRMCDYDLTRGSKVRIMPDVHAGKGCTIGTTMTITDKICPNIVGVDIGCGMYTVKLQDQVIDFEKIDEACHYIPSGMNVWEGRMERFDLTQLDKAEWNVDIVLSHTVPIEAEPVWAFIPGLDQSAVDKSTEKWLQKIYDRLDFTEWYAGHYHVESEECGVRIMYEDYDEICAEE